MRVRDGFDGAAMTRWTSHNWQIPLIASVLYVVMLVGVERYMRDRPKAPLRRLVMTWNFALSLFSLAGAAYCVPRLLFGRDGGLLTQKRFVHARAHF